jgi:hypothetical protein
MSQTPKEQTTYKEKNQPVSEETILKITKEIAIKFIEVGRLTPATFDQVFNDIHGTVKKSSRS